MRRKASTLELFMTAQGRHKPVHFGYRILVGRPLAAADLEPALARLRARHPALAARIAAEGRSRWIDTEGVPGFAVKEYGPGPSWEEILSAEISARFDDLRGPGARFALRPLGKDTELFASFHHAFGDGRASAMVLDELFRLLAGEELPAASDGAPSLYDSILPDIEEELRAMPRPADDGPPPFPPAEEIARRKARPYRAPERFSLSGWEVPAAELERLLALAKAHGLTLHSLLGAAWLRASAEVLSGGKEWTRTIQCPVDYRTYLKEGARGGYGVFNGIVTCPVDCSPGRGLLEIARSIKEGIAAERGGKRDLFDYYLYKDGLDGVDDYEAFVVGFPENPPNYDFSLSNLGRIDIAAEYGDMRVTGVFGPTFSALNGERVIGVNTQAGVLRMTYIFDPAAADEATGLAILEGAKRNLGALLAM